MQKKTIEVNGFEFDYEEIEVYFTEQGFDGDIEVLVRDIESTNIFDMMSRDDTYDALMSMHYYSDIDEFNFINGSEETMDEVEDRIDYLSLGSCDGFIIVG